MASKIAFILPYLVFMFFVVFVSVEMARGDASAYNPSYYSFSNQSVARGSNVTQAAVVSGDVEPPTCDIGGIDAMLDAAGCGMAYIGFFIGMAFISTDFLMLNVIIFLPLGIAFIWTILEVVRGV
jgi:hypothetical protein